MQGYELCQSGRNKDDFLLADWVDMKYTICGFSQEVALGMRREEIRNGKTVDVRIDVTDLTILRWFVDFYPRMTKRTIDGREYAWLKHSELVKDMPILGITPRACIARMKKLVSFGILDYALIKKEGTWSYYTFGPEYASLITSDAQKSEGIRSDVGGVDAQTMPPIDVQTYDKDPSTMDNPSAKNKREEEHTPKPQRHKYGEYQNVLLSDSELEKLKVEFPTDWEQRIERLSEYIASTGKRYKSHIATIRSWARKDASDKAAASQSERGIRYTIDPASVPDEWNFS